MPLNYNHDYYLINEILRYKSGTLYAVSIDNFTTITLEIGNKEFYNFILHLQQQLAENFNVSIFRYGYNSFFVLAKEMTLIPLDQFIRGYTYGNIYALSTIGYIKFTEPTPDLIEKSLSALQIAHNSKKAYCCYNDVFNSISISHDIMKKAVIIREALNQNSFCLFYQPVVSSSDNNVCFYESLVRIIKSENQILPAAEFIPSAELMGLIGEIDKKVIDLVIKEMEMHPNLLLAVNISVYNAEDDEWVEGFMQKLKGLPLCKRLIVEITETGLPRNYGQINQFINKLHELGCKVALDDFGSGHTSFNQLRTFAVDFIKIDGSFVKGITHDKNSQLFVKILTKVAKSLGAKTVAEFVEDKETAEMLKKLGVDFLQGNYFCVAKGEKPWLV